MPRFGLKHAMRFGLDLAPPNELLDLALRLAPMRRLAQHVYFHRRGARGLSFAEFEARLRALNPADWIPDGAARADPPDRAR